jgi:hypothetical protein
VIIRSVSSWLYLAGRQCSENLFLQRHIRVQVHLYRFERLMTEPQSNDGAINAMVEQVHGKRMPAMPHAA